MAPARVWVRQPPSSCLSGVSPIAAATTGGPATNICAVSRTITGKCDATTRAAPSPAPRPRAAAPTGARGRGRHAREVLDRDVPARQRRDVGEAHRLQRLDAAPAARAVDQAD